MKREKPSKKPPRDLSRDARALQKAAKHLPAARQEAQRLQGEADVALAEAEALKLQARVEDLTVWKMEKVKRDPEGLQDLQLLDGLLARGRQDAQCASGECREDGCRGGQAEGQGDEGGGAGLVIEVFENLVSVIQKMVSSSRIFAPRPTASSTAARSFMRNILSFAVSLKATEFFRICAYLADLGSWTT